MLYVHAVRFLFLFFKQKTAYEMRISDWSSDVCSSDLIHALTRDQVQCTFNASVDLSRRLYKLKWTPSSATRICPARQGRALRSEERSVGKACVSTGITRWSPYQETTQKGHDGSNKRDHSM